MTSLEEFKQLGLRVTWRTLLVGLEGPGRVASVVTPSEIREFAERSIDSVEGSVDVAITPEHELLAPSSALRRAAESEKGNSGREIRKWRALLLHRLLKKLPDNPVHGLLELTSFWEQFDYPAESPHVVQERGNKIAPAAYFTDGNYRDAREAHRVWLDQELAHLIAEES